MEDRFSFRAWNKKEKEYIDDIQECDNGYGVGEPCRMCFGDYLYECETYEVEQCTGMKDKNGHLIYEGDIIRGVWKDVKIEYVVKHNKCNAQFILEIPNEDNLGEFDILESDHLEIIGNIHEKPELLEESK